MVVGERKQDGPSQSRPDLSRREFLYHSGAAAAAVSLGSWSLGCAGRAATPAPLNVYTTAQLQILPTAVPASAQKIAPANLPAYATEGYCSWSLGPGLPHVSRTELAPGYGEAPIAARLLSFFTMTDIHITDKESPAQPLYIGWTAAYGAVGMHAAYAPTMLTTTQVLDAAVRTINALHQFAPLDFGICLGDATNNNQHNELRWFIDVLDGKPITPSSGAHLGAATVDYQMPFRAAGLNPAIPWYQVVGNHDQHWCGSAFEDSKTVQARVAGTVLNMSNDPNPSGGGVDRTGFYMGVMDGSDPLGRVILAGPEAAFAAPPTIAPDPGRRSLSILPSATNAGSTTANFIAEFFDTTSTPVGHGFNLVDTDHQGADFACYSFLPKAGLPIKVIVLDDTVKGAGQFSYALGGLDQARLTWLRNELQAGQDNNQLMIIAAHIPLNPQNDFEDPTRLGFFRNPMPPGFPAPVVNDAGLVAILQGYPNLLMWIAGHRHVNVVTPQPYTGTPADPTRSFWVVETSSLRDFPQQFRTFALDSHTDGNVSITVTNVDPIVVPGSPADKARSWAIGTARVFGGATTSADTGSHAYNAVLVKQLTPTMQAVIRGLH